MHTVLDSLTYNFITQLIFFYSWLISGHTYYDDDEYVHLNKKEVTKGALLFGAGLLKGVIVTGLINSANNGITIGKKR